LLRQFHGMKAIFVENLCRFIRDKSSSKFTKPCLGFNTGSSITRQAFVSGACQQVSAKAHLTYRVRGTALKKWSRTSKFCDCNSASRSIIAREVERKTGTPLYSNFKNAEPSPSDITLSTFRLVIPNANLPLKLVLGAATRTPDITPQKSSIASETTLSLLHCSTS